MPPDNPAALADRFCAGTTPAKNGLEERLDMIAAQLSVIAYELHRMNDARENAGTATLHPE